MDVEGNDIKLLVDIYGNLKGVLTYWRGNNHLWQEW